MGVTPCNISKNALHISRPTVTEFITITVARRTYKSMEISAYVHKVETLIVWFPIIIFHSRFTSFVSC